MGLLFEAQRFLIKHTECDFMPLMQHSSHLGRPKAEDPKVNISIRIPLSKAQKLRATGKGWQTRTGKFIIDGIDSGILTSGSIRKIY